MQKAVRNNFLSFLFLLCVVNYNAQLTAIGGTVNIYTPVLAIDTNVCPSTVTVASSTGFSVGDKVLIIQMKGCDFDSSNASTFGTVTNLNGAGNYEIAQITSVTGNVIGLNGRITRLFNISGKVQMVRIPTYANAQVTSLLTCNAWNGSTGGVLVIDVTGNLSLSANINVVGKGFRGGSISNNPDGGCGTGSLNFYYPLTQNGSPWSSGGAEKGEGIGVVSAFLRAGRGPLVTGGGGGNKHNTGGGGGSNFTSGGQGGNELTGCNINATGGRGGVNCSTHFNTNRLFLGGGGGSGDQNNNVGSAGVAGGGIIIIMAGSISGNGLLMTADGATVTAVGGAAADGAGGGGAGGSIFIHTSLIGSTFSASANGGGGGNQAPSGYCVGPGGGGGTGTILSNLPTLISVISSLVPGNSGIITSGPAQCLNTSYGATAGQTNTVGAIPNRSLYFTQNAAANLTINIVPSTATLCSGNSVTLIASGATNYTWLPQSTSGASLSITPPATSILTVIASNSVGCTSTVQYTQTVFPTPTLSIVSASTQICPNTAASFTASGANTYTWLPAVITGSVYSPVVTANTNYTVLGSIGTCTASSTVAQSVFIQPTINISPSTLSVCSNSVFTLTASGAQSYSWLPSGATGNTFTNSITASASYTCIGTSVNGCTASAVRLVSVKPKPTLSFTTFSITCASLGSATVSASGGIGPYTYNWSPTAQSGSVAINLFPGVYTLSVLDVGTSCTAISTTTFLPLVPLSGTVTATPSVLCHGNTNASASVALAAGSGTQTYQWSGPQGVQSTASVSNLGAGIHTLVVQDALTFCSITKTFVVTEPPALTLTPVPATATVCLGGSINVAVIAAGGIPAYSYSWQNGSTFSTAVITESLVGVYVHTVQVTDNNACKATATISAGFVSNPTITVNSASLCPMQPGLLAASGASTYLWSNGFAGAQYTAALSTNTVYTVIGAALGCTATAFSSVTILPSPTVSIISNAPLCAGDTIKLAASAAQSYVWSGPLAFSANTQSVSIALPLVSNSGIYQVTVTAANTCTAAASTSVVVYALPTPVLSAASVCEGQVLQINANYLPATSYSWTGPGGTGTSQNFTVSNSNVGMTGIYTVQTLSSLGCKSSGTVQAIVQASPSLSFLGNTVTCQGQSIQLLAQGATTYFWYGPNSFYAASPQLSFAALQPTATGNYTLIASAGVCTVVSVKQLSVYPQPVLTSSITSPVCENSPVLLSATGNGTVIWSGPGNFQWFGSSAIFTASLSAAGVYTCTIKDALQCTASQTLSLAVKPAPTLATNAVTTCVGASAVLTATGALTFTWNAPIAGTYSTASILIPVVSASNTGNYTVSTTAANGCITKTTVLLSTSSVTMPAVSFTVPPYLCYKNNNSIQASGAEFYNWSGPNNFSSTLAAISVFAGNAGAAGIYTLVVSNKQNCSVTYTNALTIVYPQKATLLSDKKTICTPGCVSFSLQPAFKDVSYYRGNEKAEGNVFCFTTANISSITATYVDTAGCSSSATLNLAVHEKPKADFLMSESEGDVSSDVFYFYNHSSGRGINKYLWIVNSSSIDSLYSENIEYRFERAGTFPVVLIASTVGNCSDTVIKYVQVREPFVLYLPNAFSPNGDGVNDVFGAKGESVDEFALTVFDRWGQQIFKAHNLTDMWDGTYKGSICKVDIYNWVLTYKVRGKAAQTKTGIVSLMR